MSEDTTITSQQIAVCDPHFHMWDLPLLPNPNLGTMIDALPAYRVADYNHDMAQLPAPLKLVSRVHVETMVGQMEGGAVLDTVGETRWVCGQLETEETALPFGVVAYVHLGRDSIMAERLIEEHAAVAKGRLCGVRMILNHHSENMDLTWPQVEHGEFLRSSIMGEGMALLEKHNLAFDLSCNPHQVADAVTLLKQFPALPVVVNHLGFFHDGEQDTHEELWREGIRAMAALPNIFMKLSMLWFGRDGYHLEAEKEVKIRSLVREVIDAFGCERCMFASNYPVDKVKAIDIPTLYGKFLDWSADLSRAECAELFHHTAVRAYNLS